MVLGNSFPKYTSKEIMHHEGIHWSTSNIWCIPTLTWMTTINMTFKKGGKHTDNNKSLCHTALKRKVVALPAQWAQSTIDYFPTYAIIDQNLMATILKYFKSLTSAKGHYFIRHKNIMCWLILGIFTRIYWSLCRQI